ncbi:hypothetical protein BCR35DRAFT_352315 [Leucosporidium creatinivorum]|uniref:Uncharacterized protein n=1 Tax=Leucosporidium creatinivorum TaxID=106004 RepID=A0A1Y2FEH5_9BASI|nr:hypothetical protein BCR35DRAFT_352315 [Leucosporidium creatinivorum]
MPLRLTYNPALPFSLAATLWLAAFWLSGLVGLIVFNFLTQSRALQCTSYPSSDYIADKCQPTPISFFSTFYTRPLTTGAVGSIGLVPWTVNGVASPSSNGPIDYSILSLNWTANPLQCAMFEQSLVLHLDSESSTMSSCYYCGPDLRILCTSVDSERTSVPVQSQRAYQALLLEYNKLLVQLHAVATTAYSNASVLSLRMDRHVKLEGVEDGVLPYNETSLGVYLGTTTSFMPITPTDANTALASIASAAEALSDIIETATSQDLQPDDPSTGVQRTLLVSYICKQCTKVRKPWVEIFAIVLAAVSAVLTPAFTLAKLLTEWLTVKPDDDQAYQPAAVALDPYGQPVHPPLLYKRRSSGVV